MTVAQIWQAISDKVAVYLGAAIIIGILTWIATHWRAEIRRWASKLLPRRYQPAASINLIHVAVVMNPSATFPLKCYVTMRSDSVYAADVRVAGYRPSAVTLQRLVLDVLQVKLGDRWFPQDHGVERIAVYPQQQFQAWIGLDSNRFDEHQARALIGQLGTLVLSVDGKPVSIPL